MARRKHLEVSDDVYEAVVAHLEGKGTKKAACEMLGIAYNVKRLDSLIEDWTGRKEQSKIMRAKKRKEAVTTSEAASIITDYLSGSSIVELSESYYRSPTIIKYQLEKYGATLRSVGVVDPLMPPLLPEQCIADSFEIGEYVWSAKYDCVAKVAGTYKGAYRIITMGGEAHRFQAYQPACDLGSLQHLIDIGVDPLRICPPMLSEEEIIHKLNEAVRNGNKRDSK